MAAPTVDFDLQHLSYDERMDAIRAQRVRDPKNGKLMSEACRKAGKCGTPVGYYRYQCRCADYCEPFYTAYAHQGWERKQHNKRIIAELLGTEPPPERTRPVAVPKPRSEEDRQARSQILDEMVREAEELGLYEATATPVLDTRAKDAAELAHQVREQEIRDAIALIDSIVPQAHIAVPYADESEWTLVAADEGPADVDASLCARRVRPEAHPIEVPVPAWCDAPPMTLAAQVMVRDAAHMERVCRAFWQPETTEVLPDLRKRQVYGQTVIIRGQEGGPILWVGGSLPEPEPTEPNSATEPESPKVIGADFKQPRKKRGPTGSRNPKTWRELHERLEALGARIVHGKTHYKVTLPNGKRTTLPISSSDYRALPNTVSDLRYMGVDVRREA